MSGSTESLASSAPPPYHKVVGRQPDPAKGDLKSEKAALGDSQGSVAGGKLRPGLLRRIWARLTCSRPYEEPPLATKPQASKAPAAPKEPEEKASRWKKPELTVQSDRHVRFVPPKYCITRYHCPIPRVTLEGLRTAHWVAALSLQGDDLSEGLLQDLPWLENLDQCWSDHVSVRPHPFDSRRLLYARRIVLAYKSADELSWEWTATATIYHQDIDWLTELSYAEVGALFKHESMIRASAFIHPSCDPLDHEEMFYKLYSKPLFEDELYPCWVLLGEPLERDEPELRGLVHKYFEKHIPDLRNYSERMMEP